MTLETSPGNETVVKHLLGQVIPEDFRVGRDAGPTCNHPFTHSSILQTFTEHLACVRPCHRCWGYQDD